MNRIDPGSRTTIRTTCTFCSYACDLDLVCQEPDMIAVDYPADGRNNQGRLCPRGSAAAVYLNHPRRLSMPRRDRRIVSWDEVQATMKKALKRPERTAITFDRNLTREEHEELAAFAAGLGIGYFASSYLEPETVLSPFFHAEPAFELSQLAMTQTVMVVGDLFHRFPMMSKPLIEWRYQDRKHRLIVIDSVNSYTAKFATDFLRSAVGYEPLILLALAGQLELADDLGIPADRIRELSSVLTPENQARIFACLAFGRTRDPLLFYAALAQWREMKKIQVVPFAGHAAWQGWSRITDVLTGVKKRTIRYVINFGEIFPTGYPALQKYLKNAEVISFIPWAGAGFLSVPVPAQMEKSGTVFTTFGPRCVEHALTPASGSRPISSLLARFKSAFSENRAPAPAALPGINIADRVARLRSPVRSRRKAAFTLIGENAAFDFMGIWSRERIFINPADARQLGLLPGDQAVITSSAAELELPVELSARLPPGVVSVPAETAVTRILFEHDLDEGYVFFLPTRVGLCRKE